MAPKRAGDTGEAKRNRETQGEAKQRGRRVPSARQAQDGRTAAADVPANSTLTRRGRWDE